MVSEAPWIGFDLDSTLAHYTHWDGGKVGEPIWPMVNLLKAYLEQGVRCKIMTARVCGMRNDADRIGQVVKIEQWCEQYIGRKLEITHEKDWAMLLLYDDRCIGVDKNTGVLLSTHPIHIQYHG